MGDSPSESEENTITQSRENNPKVMEDTEPRTEDSDRKKRSLRWWRRGNSRFKRKRFEALPEEAKFLWNLPEPLLEYATKYFTKYVNERDLKEAVTQENPVPENAWTLIIKNFWKTGGQARTW